MYSRTNCSAETTIDQPVASEHSVARDEKPWQEKRNIYKGSKSEKSHLYVECSEFFRMFRKEKNWSLKISTFWYVTPKNLIPMYCLHRQNRREIF
jgi:hypothetical protein